MNPLHPPPNRISSTRSPSAVLTRSPSAVLALLVALLWSGSSWAWWDTQIQVVRQPPTVRDIQAEAGAGFPAEHLVADDAAWGGKAASLQPGGAAIVFEHDCAVSHYRVDAISRGEVADDAAARKLPVVLALKVTHLKSGKSIETRQRVAYLASRYEDGAHLYVAIREPGKYRFELRAHDRSRAALRVDYLALKDLFHGFPTGGNKTKQTLHTAAEIAALRAAPASVKLANKLLAQQIQKGLGSKEDVKAWQPTFFADIWASLPPRNLHFNNGIARKDKEVYDKLVAKAKEKGATPLSWILRKGWGAWTFEHPTTGAVYTFADHQAGKVMGDCVLPDDLSGYHANVASGDIPQHFDANLPAAALMARYGELLKLVKRQSDAYLRTGNEVAGWEAACALVAAADLYPDLDFQTQKWDFNGAMFGLNPLGKLRYSGHAIGNADMLITAYDAVFPIIQKEKMLAQLLSAHIPWIRSNYDIIRMLDRNLCQHIRDCVDRQVIRHGDGDSEAVCVKAALVQGPGVAGDWILELPFTRCHMRMTNRGGLQDHFVSTANADGSNYIGSIEYSKAFTAAAADCVGHLARYKQLGGKPKYDLDDTDRYPNVVQGAYFNLNRSVAGGLVPRIGDWGLASDGSHIVELQHQRYRQLYSYAFRKTGDARFAYWLKYWGRASEDDKFWAKIEAAAATIDHAPYLANSTRAMPGFGMGVLEAGEENRERWKKSAVILRAGVGQGHGHNDQLSILYYANGIRALPNNGRRGGRNNSRSTRWHNTLEIDEKEFMPKKMGSSGVGWLETVKDLGGGLGYTRGLARSPSHPHVKMFRRDVALIPVGPDDAVVYDVFRVDGGRIHTWASAGPVSPREGGVEFSVPMKRSVLADDQLSEIKAANREGKEFDPSAKPGSLLVDRYLGGWNERQQGQCDDQTRITWQVKESALKRYYDRNWPENDTNSRVTVRAWRLGAKGDVVMSAFGGFSDYAVKSAPTRNFVYTRREAAADGLAAVYPTVSECYRNDQALIEQVEQLPVKGAGPGALAATAVKMTTHNGRTIVAMNDGQPQRTLKAAGVTAQGEFACAVEKDGQLEHLALVGGTHAASSGFEIKPVTARHEAAVTGLDFATNSIVVDRPLDALVTGDNFHVRRQGQDHHINVIVKGVVSEGQGSRLQLASNLKVYQSAIVHFNESGDATLDMPPVLQETDPGYYDGLAVLNEQNEVQGKATFRRDERFMSLRRPGHQAWRQTLKGIEDVPDADGDGKRTLRMLATKQQVQMLPVRKVVKEGEVMKTLIVTRVSEQGDMIWFREADPNVVFGDSVPVAHRHWPYQDQKLVTENGRELFANYPGDEIFLGCAGKKLSADDFPDVDGDGRRVVALAHLNVGDVLTSPSAVSLRMVSPMAYRLEANCAVKITVKKKHAALALVSDGRVQMQPFKGKHMDVTADMLRAGELYVVLRDAEGSYALALSE